MNKMKPEDVMRALECWASDRPAICKDCAYRRFDGTLCGKGMARDALALLREKDALLEEWDAKCKDYETELIGKAMDIEKLKACCDEKDAIIAELTKIISEMKGENYD